MVGMAMDLATLPYRCPKCDQNADFPTLEGLRRHLAIDHSYGVYGRDKATRRNVESSGRVSPLTESFVRQRQLLEEQLRRAQLRESQSHYATQAMRNSADSIRSTQSPSDISKISLKPRLRSSSYIRAHQVDRPQYDSTSRLHADATSRENEVISRQAKITSQEKDNTSREHASLYNRRHHSPPVTLPEDPLTIDDLHSNEQPRRAPRRQRHRTRDDVTPETSRWHMADALAKTRDHVDSMKRTADSVVHQQAALIELLRQELKAKDERLDDVRKQLSILHGDRQKLLTKVARLNRDQDQSADNIAKLSAKVEEKDRNIKEKEREVEELSSFLKGVSEEEQAAQAHLEVFITSLTTRAERAESALTALGTQGASLGTPEKQSSAVDLHRSSSDAYYAQPQEEEQQTFPQRLLSARANLIPRSSPLAQQGAARTPRDQVNPPVGSSLPFSTPPQYVTPSQYATPPQYATPTLMKALSVETPPFTPPAVDSPIRNGSSVSSEQSMLATSGYLSQATAPTTLSSAPLCVNQCEKGGDGISKRSLSLVRSASLRSSVSTQCDGFPSPMSPGEIIVNQPHWFMSEQSGGWGQGQQEGAESVLSDSQGSLSDHQAQSTLSFQAKIGEGNQLRENQISDIESTVPDVTQSHRRVASWGPDSAEGTIHLMAINAERSLSHSLPLSVSKSNFRYGGPSPTCLDRARRKWGAMTCVFRYLDTASLSRMSLVCREWRDISRQPSLWRKVCLQRAAVSSKFLVVISQWCSQLQSLTLEGLTGRNRRPGETSEQHKKAVRGSLESGLEALLAGAGDSLRSLRVVDCSHVLTDRCLWLASCHSRLLQRVAYVSETDPPGSEVIWALGAGCRDIQTLIIPPKYPNSHPSRFTDRCLTMTAACWPQLLVLCIGGIEVTGKGLTAIAKSCSRLQVLELDHLCEVTEDVAVSMCRHGLRGLLTLEFASTPVTPRALLHFVSSCANLQSVRIHLSIADYFKNTTDPDNQRHYQDVMSKLQMVRSRPGMSEIIYIRDTS